MKMLENMLRYLLEETPWPGRDSKCLESSNTSSPPTDDRLPLARLSRHAREPPTSYDINDNEKALTRVQTSVEDFHVLFLAVYGNHNSK